MAKVKRSNRDGIEILSLHGNFFGDTETDDLMRHIQDLVAEDNRKLIVDFTDCDGMASLSLSAMVRAHVNYTSRKAEIKICGLGKRVKQLFVVTKLIMLFEHFETLEEALESFRQKV